MMDYVSKLQATSLVFQKDDLLVCSINHVIESPPIDVFEVMKMQTGKNYKSIFDNMKEERGDVIYKTSKLNK